MTKVEEAIARFPETFDLRAADWAGLTFRIAPAPASFEDNGKVHLVVQVNRNGKWLDFIRTTEAELKAEIKLK